MSPKGDMHVHVLVCSRNIIERTYPQQTARQGTTMLAEDEALLLRFKQARERESQLKDKVAPQLRRDEIRRLVTGLCCIFTAIIALLASSLTHFPLKPCVVVV